MWKIMVLLVAIMLFDKGYAWADIPASQPSTQPAKIDLKESEAVRVNGVDFQLVAPRVWIVPLGDLRISIPLALKVTNQTDRDIHLLDTCRIVLTDAAGKTLSVVADKQEGNFPSQPPLLTQGQCVNLKSPAQLTLVSDRQSSLRLSGVDGQFKPWHIDGLKPGKYTLGMIYENAEGDAQDPSVWVGKATTKPWPIEITDHSAIVSEPAVKDGLAVQVTLPKATFAVNEPLTFTVGLTNTSKKPFQLFDLDYQWDWQMRIEGQGQNGAWQVHRLSAEDRLPFNPTPMKAGQSREVPGVLDHSGAETFEYVWDKKQGREILPVENLPPGRYRFTLQMDLKADSTLQRPRPPFWTGQIASRPVEFEIGDQGVPTPQASKPVRVNGAEFQVIAPLIWRIPMSEQPTTFIPLELRVSNHSDKALQLNLGDCVHLKDAVGNELSIQRDGDSDFPFKPVVVAKTKSARIDRHATLSVGATEGTFRLSGADGLAGVWFFDDLLPGQYTLFMTYENTAEASEQTVKAYGPLATDPKDVPFWSGKVTTEELTIEITDTTVLAAAEAAWQKVLATLQAGDKKALGAVATAKGLQSLIGEKGDALTAQQMQAREQVWAKWPLRWVKKSETTVNATMGPEAKEHGLEFVKTSEGWKFNEWTPGE